MFSRYVMQGACQGVPAGWEALMEPASKHGDVGGGLRYTP